MKIKYTHLILIALLILSGALAYNAFTSYITRYLTVSQVVENNTAYLNKEIQVIGDVVNGSKRFGDDNSLLFNLTDGEFTIAVTYTGQSKNFNEGDQIVVIGELTSLYALEGHDMLVSCPSKYEGGGNSLLTDPIFLTAMLLGSGAIVYSVVSISLKRKKTKI